MQASQQRTARARLEGAPLRQLDLHVGLGVQLALQPRRLSAQRLHLRLQRLRLLRMHTDVRSPVHLWWQTPSPHFVMWLSGCGEATDAAHRDMQRKLGSGRPACTPDAGCRGAGPLNPKILKPLKSKTLRLETLRTATCSASSAAAALDWRSRRRPPASSPAASTPQRSVSSARASASARAARTASASRRSASTA